MFEFILAGFFKHEQDENIVRMYGTDPGLLMNIEKNDQFFLKINMKFQEKSKLVFLWKIPIGGV